MNNLEVWVYGLVSAAVSGGSGVVGTMYLDPDHFNFNNGISKLAGAWGMFALIGVLNYLKQSPVPKTPTK